MFLVFNFEFQLYGFRNKFEIDKYENYFEKMMDLWHQNKINNKILMIYLFTIFITSNKT